MLLYSSVWRYDCRRLAGQIQVCASHSHCNCLLLAQLRTVIHPVMGCVRIIFSIGALAQYIRLHLANHTLGLQQCYVMELCLAPDTISKFWHFITRPALRSCASLGYCTTLCPQLWFSELPASDQRRQQSTLQRAPPRSPMWIFQWHDHGPFKLPSLLKCCSCRRCVSRIFGPVPRPQRRRRYSRWFDHCWIPSCCLPNTLQKLTVCGIVALHCTGLCET